MPNVTHPHDMPTEALAPRVSLGTLSATTPDQLLTGAAAIAKPLARVIEDQKLYSVISGRRYVKVEGWTTLGAMLGVIAREVENTEDNGVYVAKVQLVRLADGAVISEASAECGREEPIWQKRPAYARRSMAATRATGKACRLAFSWVMTMAGFEATPAEEMDGVVIETAPAPRAVLPQTKTDAQAEVERKAGESKVQQVTSKPTKNGREFYEVVFTNDVGGQVGFFDDAHADVLRSALGAGQVVRYVLKPAMKAGKRVIGWFDLESVSEV